MTARSKAYRGRHLTAAEKAAILLALAQGTHARVLAKEYDTTVWTIRRIKRDAVNPRPKPRNPERSKPAIELEVWREKAQRNADAVMAGLTPPPLPPRPDGIAVRPPEQLTAPLTVPATLPGIHQAYTRALVELGDPASLRNDPGARDAVKVCVEVLKLTSMVILAMREFGVNVDAEPDSDDGGDSPYAGAIESQGEELAEGRQGLQDDFLADSDDQS